MTPTVTVNNAEFNRVLQMIARESSRTYPEVANGQGLALSSRALRNTIKADANKIAVQLGQIATERRASQKVELSFTGGRVRNRVRFKRIYRTDQDSLAHKIVNARLKKAGQPLIWGDELDKAARRMIGARLRAVAFIRSGWVYSIRTLSKLVGYKDARGVRPSAGEATRMTGQAKGYAVPAQRVFNDVATCTVANTALIREEGNPMPIAEAGLNVAFAESVRDMLNHLAGKLQPVFKKYGR